MVGVNATAFLRKCGSTAYDVLQFPHIARPGIAFEYLKYIWRKTIQSHAMLLQVILQKMLCQDRDVLYTFPQRRNVNRELTQPIV